MSSMVDTCFPQSLPQQLVLGEAAVIPNPLSHRLRIRQRLGPHVYLADAIVNPVGNTTSFAPAQLVLKIGRLLRPWEHATPTPSTLGAWQELRVAKQLIATGGHRHVVQPLQVHVEKRTSFLVLEYCTGGDLFGHVTTSTNGALPIAEALKKCCQIAHGVHFLHSQNIAHRDLSLENILLHDGDCKICDFGLSTRANALAKDVVGKTAYAAPEVVLGDWYDPVRADLWSLGVVLFMMLTGSPLVPFASPACAEFKALRTVGVRGVLSAWGMDMAFSVATIDLLSRLLEIRPENRMATTQELLNHPVMVAASMAAQQPPRNLTLL